MRLGICSFCRFIYRTVDGLFIERSMALDVKQDFVDRAGVEPHAPGLTVGDMVGLMVGPAVGEIVGLAVGLMVGEIVRLRRDCQ